ncbi:MAG: alpha-L-rhamnosidase C-terminal domain-containing protein [Victivallales bacterium]|nr:alpha-L-rhamnosidase C-terminal domain-containing protein [Victivallales bacterium]
MGNTALPENITAKWIWDSSLLDLEDSYLFARKCFTLNQSSVDADFWISANHSYQLFVNGRFVGSGPSPAPQGIAYADYYNLSFYMVTGVNVIAIVAHHTNFDTYCDHRKAPGLWCQLNINGEPAAASGADWKIFPGQCYQQARPRRGKFLEFVEICDLNHYPRGWRADNYFDHGWSFCEHSVPVDEFPCRLEALPFDAPEFEELTQPWNMRSRGAINPMAMLVQVHFEDVIAGGGTYAARAHLHTEAECRLEAKLYSDDPSRVLVNGRQLCRFEATREANAAVFTIDFQAGWNEIIVVQEVRPAGMGALLSFTGVRKGAMHFHETADIAAADGWRVYGPLRKPFAEITAALNEDRAFCGVCRNDSAMISDAQAYLDSCTILPQPTVQQIGGETALGYCEYAVFDMGHLRYGFPGISFRAQMGDVVDICYGETLNNLKLPVNNHQARSVDTLYLRGGDVNWMKYEPCCFRYIMIATRRCVDKVTVKGLFVVDYSKNYRKDSFFNCSDEELNNIWDISRYLSLLAAKSYFIGTPFHRKAQYLGDTCIMSRNSYYLFSDYNLARKALREYALSQYEDGSLPTSPFGVVTQNDIDQMLMFPLWIQEYFKFSGDRKFIEKIMPYIERLNRFIEKNAAPDSSLLEEFEPWKNISFFRKEQIDKRGMVTALNALYCRALFSTAELYHHLGDQPKAEDTRYQAARIAAKVRKLTYNQETGLYADCYADGKPSDRCSLFSNIAALYSGIALPEQADTILEHFFGHEEPFAELAPDRVGIICQMFVLDTLYAYGRSQLALDYLRFCHRSIAGDKPITPGAALDRTVPCSSYLIQELAGIRLAKPGFSTIYFHPAVSAVKAAKVALPTAYGRIKLDWRIDDAGNLRAKIDANYPLEVVPEIPEEIQSTLMLGKSVVVLDPNSADNP